MTNKNTPIVKTAKDMPTQEIAAGKQAQMQVLVSTNDAPNFAMRKFIMQPGGGMPKHTNEVEHEQYVVRGQAKVGIGDEVFQVKQGDFLYIPAKVPHWYSAEGSEPFEFLCLVPNLPDKITLL